MVVTLEVLNTEANIRRVKVTRTAVIGRGKECGLRIASRRISPPPLRTPDRERRDSNT